jgi:hypothetical protein
MARGPNLRSPLGKLGIRDTSQKAVAARMKCSQGTVSKLERTRVCNLPVVTLCRYLWANGYHLKLTFIPKE